MLRPTCNIKINDLEFDFLNELEIESNWKTITDSGFLKIPRRFRRGDKTLVAGENGIFKRGDRISINLGYYPESSNVFLGYITGITPDSPFEIRFQDAAYLFKQTSITKSYESVNLNELLTEFCPIEFESIDVELGAFRISNANFAQVLTELKKTYGLVSWVRADKLFCGLAYVPSQQRTHKLSFQRNIIESSLEYLREDDIKIKVKGVSIMPDNSRIEITDGDPDGEERTLFYHGLSKQELTKIVNRELPKLKFEGYRGDLITFGTPQINHGDAIELEDIKFPERKGSYLVDGVVITQGLDGFRQSIKLGAKI